MFSCFENVFNAKKIQFRESTVQREQAQRLWNGIQKNLDKNVKVNWKTEKNHKVIVTVDSKDKMETISNSEWLFEVQLKDLASWKHTVNAEILDADGD